MKFSIKDFFGKYDSFHSFLRIWSHLLKKSLMENFNFLCIVTCCLTFAILCLVFYFLNILNILNVTALIISVYSRTFFRCYEQPQNRKIKGLGWLNIFIFLLYQNIDSRTVISLWILLNFSEHLFYRTPLDDCFWTHKRIEVWTSL